MRTKLARWRWLAILAVLAMVAAACQSDTGTETTEAGGETTTTAAAGETTTTAAPTPTGFTYRLGIFQDTTTDNFWASYDPESTVWNSYVLNPTKPALFTINYPGIDLVADVSASAEVPVAGADNSVTVPMRPDAVWSDGTPITADDVVFTFETVRDLALGGDWLTSFPLPDPENPDVLGISSVEAVDANTVKITFSGAPGLAIWPHSIGIAPIMPKHFWEPIVEEAKASSDPATTLYAASGAGDPSGGPVVFDSREEGAFARNVANENYYATGEEQTSGGVTYTTGPYLSEAIFSLYSDQSAAVLALKDGEVDYLLNPLGMQRGLQAQVEGDANLTSVVNPTNGFRYLAFNLRREPMSIPQFRDALALMIDKEFMANNVLQGVAFPLYATVPEGNTYWYDEAIADEIASQYAGKDTATRLAEAIALLKEAGFSWEVEPKMDDAGRTVIGGEGVTLNGQTLPELEILAPGPGYDPLRATYSVWIETWLNQLGFEAEANPTDFNAIVDRVYTPTDAGELDFDMYILGWSLGSPALPTYHKSFWSSTSDAITAGGNNNTGFDNPEFEALVQEFDAATELDQAKSIMWEMERILAKEKPYILLFDTGILEFYRQASINYPFTSTLSGLQFLQGLQGLVSVAQ